MSVRLLLESGAVLERGESSITIGSSAECQIVLPNDERISPVHATLRKIGNRWLIESSGAPQICVDDSSPLQRHWLLKAGQVIHLTPDGPTLVFQPPDSLMAAERGIEQPLRAPVSPLVAAPARVVEPGLRPTPPDVRPDFVSDGPAYNDSVYENDSAYGVERPAPPLVTQDADAPPAEVTQQQMLLAKQAWQAWQAQQTAQQESAQSGTVEWQDPSLQIDDQIAHANESIFGPSRIGLTLIVLFGVLGAAGLTGYIVWNKSKASKSTITAPQSEEAPADDSSESKPEDESETDEKQTDEMKSDDSPNAAPDETEEESTK